MSSAMMTRMLGFCCCAEAGAIAAVAQASDASRPSQRFPIVLILDLLGLNWTNDVSRAFRIPNSRTRHVRGQMGANCLPSHATKSRPIVRVQRCGGTSMPTMQRRQDDGCSIWFGDLRATHRWAARSVIDTCLTGLIERITYQNAEN